MTSILKADLSLPMRQPLGVSIATAREHASRMAWSGYNTRLCDSISEIQRFVAGGLIDAVVDQTRLLACRIERHSNDCGLIMLIGCINANPNRHRPVGRQMTERVIDATIPFFQVDELT